jgi:hypothetical protein
MIDLAPYTHEKAQCLERLQSLHAEAKALERAESECAGGVRWKTVQDKEYLVRNFVDPETAKRRFVSLGARSPRTEALLRDFERRKGETEAQRERLDERLRVANATAKAIRLGRLPAHVGDVVRALYASELSERLVLSGSLALLAYETQVRAAAPSEVLAPAGSKPDIDLFVGDERDLDLVEAALLSVDSSFRREGHGARRFGGPVAVDCFTRSDLCDIAGTYDVRSDNELVAAFTAEPMEANLVDRSGRMAQARVLPITAFRTIKAIRSRRDVTRPDAEREVDAMQAEAAGLIADRLRAAGTESEMDEDDDWGGLEMRP